MPWSNGKIPATYIHCQYDKWVSCATFIPLSQRIWNNNHKIKHRKKKTYKKKKGLIGPWTKTMPFWTGF